MPRIRPCNLASTQWLIVLVSLGTTPALAQFQFGPTGGGPGAPGSQERKLVGQFDADGNGRLDAAERARALENLAQTGTGRSGRAGGGGGRGNRPPSSQGVRLAPNDVKNFPADPLYNASALRTFFIEFENPNWESELVAFNDTDVEVPARVTVDGMFHRDVGIHFRGNSSFGVGNGYKRSLNLSFDFVHGGQEVGGYRTLNFLNANGDPTLMRSVLFLHIARQFLPAPKANFVRVVINGENWGVYANVQQFNRDFIDDWFPDAKGGARWKVPGGGGRGMGGLAYLGDNPEAYKGAYEIKSKDDPADWAALIKLTKTLAETPPARLQAALAPMLDIDGALRFLALDNALMSADGYWTRASDYSLYRDSKGVFHVIAHDVNETFMGRGGGGGGGGRGGGQAQPAPMGNTNLSPLVNEADTTKPLAHHLLAVPALRTRYLGYVREIAEKWLDWDTLGPVVRQYEALIADDVARDTHKLFSTQEFLRGVSNNPAPGNPIALRTFADQRRAFLLNWLEQN